MGEVPMIRFVKSITNTSNEPNYTLYIAGDYTGNAWILKFCEMRMGGTHLLLLGYTL